MTRIERINADYSSLRRVDPFHPRHQRSIPSIFCSGDQGELWPRRSSFGNAHTGLTTPNALRLLTCAGRDDIPLAHGAHQPLQRVFDRPGATAQA